MNYRKAFLILLQFVFINNCFIAQNYSVKQYSTKDGLSNQIVSAVFQDKSGYIWFATQSGVNYFNGTKIQSFEPSKELIGVDVTTINEDANGIIWIGTNADGLFNVKNNTVNHFRNIGSANNPIRTVFLDKSKVIWILTSKGVYKYLNEKFIQIKDEKGVFARGVLSMEQMPDGTFWFGTQGQGLVSLKNGKYNYYGSKEGVRDNYIFSLAKKGDSLLIGTTNQGVLIKYENVISELKLPGIENAWISNIIQKDDELIIFSSSGIAMYANDSTYTLITEKNGISSNDIYYGLKDNENNLWLATGNGLNLIRSEEIISFDEKYGLTDQKVTCLLYTKNNQIIAGTYGFGINVLDEASGSVTKVQHPEIMDFRITTLAEDFEQKELWIGGEKSKNTVVILDMTKKGFPVKRKITTIKKTRPNTLTKIIIDQKKNKWFSSYDSGLFQISKTDTIHYHKDNFLPSNFITTFIIGNDGNPMVCIYNKGIITLNPATNKFEPISQNKTFNREDVVCLTQDKHGVIYAGTSTSGFYIVKDADIYHYTTKDGLLSNSIQSIICESNTIWLGTVKGLNKIILDKNLKILKIESYNEKSGLINSEIQQENLLVTEEFIWIASSSGLSRMKKDKKNNHQFKPKLELQSVKLFFEDVDWKKKNFNVNQWGVPTSVNLGYKENHLTITFGALTTSQVQYSYFLEGQDDNWTPYSDKNEATLSNLAPGHYTFKLKAKNNLGAESDEISFIIVIRKPFWQMWWFRVVISSLIVLLIIAFIRNREKRFKAQNIRLERTVKERTKEAVAATEKAETQRVLVEEKNKEILSSIVYAKRIQNAMLPAVEMIQNTVSEIEVFYRPKDIVAGDFYWFEETHNHVMIAAADCTGHGVPGALISVVCFNALNRSVREFGLVQPGEILDQTRSIIINELSKQDENVKDGMDISLVVIEKSSKSVSWAGANNPLWKVNHSGTSVEEIKGNKQPIGMHISDTNYTTHKVEYIAEDTFILLTDGYSDQFGGPNGKKFKPANFKKLLQEYSSSSLKLMAKNIAINFDAWKTDEEQVDDVCVIIFRI